MSPERSVPDLARVPVLTEVVDLPLPPAPTAAAEPVAATAPPAPPPAAPAIDADALAQRVLGVLQPRVDAWLEQRVGAALAPALERAAREFAADAREGLAAPLREWVGDAVAQALAEPRGR